MPLPHSPNQNHLLAALPTAEFEFLAPHLELVLMPLGEILYEPGMQLHTIMHYYALMHLCTIFFDEFYADSAVTDKSA